MSRDNNDPLLFIAFGPTIIAMDHIEHSGERCQACGHVRWWHHDKGQGPEHCHHHDNGLDRCYCKRYVPAAKAA